MAPVRHHDLYYIKYTDDFQTFVDISIVALIIYISTEFYVGIFRPSDEVNLSLIWCGMAFLYGVSTLSSIARHYLRTEEGALLYIFAGLSFVLSLIIQLADTKFLDFNLKDAFRNFTSNSISLIDAATESYTRQSTTQKLYSHLKTYSTNELLFSFCIAVISGFIGAILFFPSFRLARLHFLCLKYSDGSKIKRLLSYVNFLMPLLVSLYVPSKTPSTEENSTTQQFLSAIFPKSNHSQTNYSKELIKSILFASNIKLYLILVIFVLRLSLFKHYAQSYLNLAFELAAVLRKNTARITNTKYMSTISSIYQYYGVVASQYVIPLFVLLFLALMLKTLGDYSWCGEWDACNQMVDNFAQSIQSFKPNNTVSSSLFKKFETETFNLTTTHNVFSKVFTPTVMRSIIGYFTFWTATVWFAISCFGLLYYQYIDRQAILE